MTRFAPSFPVALSAAVLLLPVLLAPSPAGGAVTGAWQALGGPEAGSVEILVASPAGGGVLWAAAAGGGLFRSTDAGASWAPVGGTVLGHHGSGLDLAPTWPRLPVIALAADPVDRDVAYVSTLQTVLKTTDGGATWLPIGLGGGILAIAIAPSAPNVVYMTDETTVLRSNNGGATWRPVKVFDFNSFPVFPLVVDPLDPLHVLAGTFYRGMIQTRDGGLSWHQLPNRGFPVPLQPTSLLIDPFDPATLYAGTYGGIFRSHDRGRTWSALDTSPALGQIAISLAVDPSTPGALLACMLQSDVQVTVPNADDAQLIRSRDGGTTWELVVDHLAFNALAFDPATPGRIYGGVDRHGVLVSLDGGGTWAPSAHGLTATVAGSLAVGSGGSMLYAGVLGPAGRWRNGETFIPLGVFRSADGGLTWSEANRGLDDGRGPPAIVNLLVDPASPAIAYALTSSGDRDAAGLLSQLLFRTEDAGATWQLLTLCLSSVFDLAFDPAEPATIYVTGESASTGALAVAKSLDHGTTSELIAIPSTQGPATVAVDPRQPSTVYLVSEGDVLVSADGGLSWAVEPPTDVGGFQQLFVLPGPPGVLFGFPGLTTLFVGTPDWSDGSFQSYSDPIKQIALDFETGVIFGATVASGVFASADGGQTWTPAGSGLVEVLDPNLSPRAHDDQVAAIAIASGPGPAPARTLYAAGLTGGKVYALSLAN